MLLGHKLQQADENSCSDLLNLLRGKVKSSETESSASLIQVSICCMQELNYFFPEAQNEVKLLLTTMFDDIKSKFGSLEDMTSD